MSGTRREVLRLYKTIMRLGQRWEASNPIETRVEREYIADEARLAEKVALFFLLEPLIVDLEQNVTIETGNCFGETLS